MDRRERILTRVWDLLKTIPGMATHVRNRGELPEELRPALVLLDADESVELTHTQARGQLRTPPMIVVMRPQIFITLKDREPKNEGIGEELNRVRRLVLPILLPTLTGDDTLKTLVGANGFIRYEGLLTDMATGRSMRGELQFLFAFGYVLRLDELQQGA
jgi:hypothetical protein